MPGGLPEGLVTSTEAIQGDIERVDRVAVEDIQQLWKGAFGSMTDRSFLGPLLIKPSLLDQQVPHRQRCGETVGELLLADLEQ